MKKTLLYTTALLSALLTHTVSANQICYGQVPQEKSSNLNAVITVSEGNDAFLERKCTDHYFQYYKDNIGFSQSQCESRKAEVSLDKGFAPLGVFFRGWESTPKADIDTYRWEIRSKAGAVLATYDAFNAAYIFEQPGEYEARLTVTSKSGATSTTSHPVTVWERKRYTYYVDNQLGDDRYNGLSQTPDTSCKVDSANLGSCEGPWKTATRALGEMSPFDVTAMPSGKYTTEAICTKKSASQPHACVETVKRRTSHFLPGDQVLFNRGQNFELETSMAISNESGATSSLNLVQIGHWSRAIGVHFGAYGSGNKPLIQNVGSDSNAVINWQGVGAMHLSMSDLAFDLQSSKTNPSNIQNRANFVVAYANPTNLVFNRIEVKRMNQGIIATTDEGQGNGLFVFDSKFHDSSVTQLFTSNSFVDVAVVNSKFDFSANHLLYTSIDSGLIYNNEMTRPAFGRTAFRLSNGSLKKPNRFVWVSDNKMFGWIDPRTGGRAFSNGQRYNFSLVNISPNVPELKAVHDVVFTRNHVKDAENLLAVGNAENLKVIDNVFETSDASSTHRIDMHNNFSKRPLRNIEITDNRFIEKNDTDEASSVMHLRHADENICSDQNVHEKITVSGNVFELRNGHRRVLTFSQGNLSLDAAEQQVKNTVKMEGNELSSPNAEMAILQVGGDFRSYTNNSVSDWSNFFSGVSSTGGEYRLYNKDSRLTREVFSQTAPANNSIRGVISSGGEVEEPEVSYPIYEDSSQVEETTSDDNSDVYPSNPEESIVDESPVTAEPTTSSSTGSIQDTTNENGLVTNQPELTYCTSEGRQCDLPENKLATVRYGLNHHVFKENMSGSFQCNNQTFGDPEVGKGKYCHYFVTGEVSQTEYSGNTQDDSVSSTSSTSVSSGTTGAIYQNAVDTSTQTNNSTATTSEPVQTQSSTVETNQQTTTSVNTSATVTLSEYRRQRTGIIQYMTETPCRATAANGRCLMR